MVIIFLVVVAFSFSYAKMTNQVFENDIINKYSQIINLNRLKPWTKELVQSYQSSKKVNFIEMAILTNNIEALNFAKKLNLIKINNNNKSLDLLTLATLMNNFDAVKIVLKSDKNFNLKQDCNKNTYRALALLDLKTSKIFNYLLNHNLNENFIINTPKGDMAFFFAVLIFGTNSITETMFNNIDKLNIKNQRYALEFCVMHENQKWEKIVRKKGVKDTLYTRLYSKNEDDKTLKLIEKQLKNWQPDNKIDGHDSLLRWAFESGSYKKIKLVLDNVPSEIDNNFLKRGKREITILSIALDRCPKNENFYKILQLLLDKGAQVNIDLDKYISPMYIATAMGDLQALKMFKNKGGNIVELDEEKKGMLALLIALNSKNEVIKFYLKNGANLNYMFKGLPALAWAVKKERLEVIKLLLKHGAKREFIDSETKKSISIVDWTKKLNAKTPLKNYSKIMKVLK